MLSQRSADEVSTGGGGGREKRGERDREQISNVDKNKERVGEGRPPTVPMQVENEKRHTGKGKERVNKIKEGVGEGDETTWGRYGGMGRGVTIQAGM